MGGFIRLAGLAFACALAAFPACAETFEGPGGSFSMDFGPEWQVIQAQNRGGMICKAESCGADRVFCIVLPRSDEAAVPGKPLPDVIVNKFAEGVTKMPPAGMKSDYVAPFAPRTLGAVQGSWAEIRASGDKPAVHFALFLFAAHGFDIALSCGAPDARWADHKPKIETLLSAVTLNPNPPAPPAPGASVPAPQQDQPK